MRVAMIDPSLFTLPYDVALSQGLTAGGHDVTLYGRTPDPGDGAANVRLVPHFYRLSSGRFASALPRPLHLGMKGVEHVGAMLALLRRLWRERPDVIHFQWLPLPLADRYLLTRFRRVAPLVLTVHDTNPFNGAPSAGLQATGMALCFSEFDRMIVHTAQGETRLREQGVPAERLALLPHGLLKPLPSGLPHDDFTGEITFLLFGKIKPYKGLDLLIEAFARLPNSLKSQARLRVVGKPYMDLASTLARARTLGVDARLSLEPVFVPDAEIGALFTSGTIAVFPYREIEASGVLSLALAYGRPIIASALGSFREVLQSGVQGLLVPPEDVDALAAALERVISDREFTAGCASRALTLARATPGWEAIGRETALVYEQAVRTRQGARPALRSRSA